MVKRKDVLRKIFLKMFCIKENSSHQKNPYGILATSP